MNLDSAVGDKASVAEEFVEKLRKNKTAVFWAKQQSFPYWPSRFATQPELDELSEVSKASEKTKQVGVVFLGLAKTKGWVNLTSIKSFTEETLNGSSSEFFKEKKFLLPGQKDFRYGVREAMRIVQAADGNTYSDSLLSMLEKYAEKEEPLELAQSQICDVCKGGESAGPLLFCNACNAAGESTGSDHGEGQQNGLATHFHCLPIAQKYRDVLWYCNNCCGANGTKPGQVVEIKAPKIDKVSRDKKDKDATDKDGSQSEKKRGRPYKSGNHDSDKHGNSPSKRSKGEKSIKQMDKDDGNGKKRKDRSDTEDSDLISFRQSSSSSSKHRGGTSTGSRDSYENSGARKGTRGHVPVVPSGIAEMRLSGRKEIPRSGSLDEDSIGSDEEEDVEMEYCFVCGDGGTLVLCDFPKCPRAYHQACVAPTFPQLLDEAPGTSAEALDDPWFCPCHTCNFCNTLQATPNLDSRFLIVPKHYHKQMAEEIAHRTVGSSSSGSSNSSSSPIDTSVGKALSLKQAPLTNCEGCPFSVCPTCELDYGLAHSSDHAGSSNAARTHGAGKGIGDEKQGTGNGSASSKSSSSLFQKRDYLVPPGVVAANAFRSDVDTYHYCMNCCSPSSQMKLARILEMAWSRMCQSRFALPFLVPFLKPRDPTKEDVEADKANELDVFEDISNSTAPTIAHKFPRQTHSFVEILAKIRSVTYTCAADFVHDVKSLRELITDADSARKDFLLNIRSMKEKPRARSGSTSSVRSDKSATGAQKVQDMVDAGFLHDANIGEPTIKDLNYFPDAKQAESLLRAFDTVFKLCEGVIQEKKWQISKYEGEIFAAVRSTADPNNSRENAMNTTSSATAGASTITSDIVTDSYYWRQECDKELPYRDTSNVLQRTMPQWVSFLQGNSTRRNRNTGEWSTDTYKTFDKNHPQAGSALRDVLEEEYSMGTTAVYSCQNPDSTYQDYDTRQIDAAKIMSSFGSVPRNEKVTLLEEGGRSAEYQDWESIQDHYKSTHANGGGKSSNKHTSEDAALSSGNVFSLHNKRALKNYAAGQLDEHMAQDNTLVVLDRLKQLTRKTLHLEADLRREYIDSKQFVQETGIDKIVVGEMPLVRELKLANDDLRWRLSQKGRALLASQEMVVQLQAEVLSLRRQQ